MGVVDAETLEQRAARAVARARDRLLDLQHPDGWWKGELQTNVTMDAEDLLMREFLGIRTREETALAASWIRSQQREDGSFGTYFGGPPDLSTTVEAYAALRLSGEPPESERMKRAREVILGLGGIESSRVFTRIWLALFGEWSWQDLPALPPEVVLLPPWFPLNVYDFACWARQTIVPLTIVASHRPVRPLPFSLAELRAGERREQRHPAASWAGAFQRLDRALHAYEKRPLGWLRRAARTRGIEWIIRRQEADGGWGGIQPPWVYSILALHLEGYGHDHPVVRQALAGLDGFLIEEGDERRLEACQSPVWDTALVALALRDAGVAPDHPALRRAARWLLDEEVRVRGDWSVRRPDLEPGGWAFEFENDGYPDVDDTAEVILALRAAASHDPDATEAAVRRGVRWTLGMQCRDGGFAAFDVDNTRELCTKLPFCDFGEVIDPPSADVTAHAIEMLAAEGCGAAALDRAVAWLLAQQEPCGSWFGRWGANHLYGTGAALPALARAGLAPEHPAIRRAVGWLSCVQNPDGGWGEDLRSYEPEGRPGVGASTPSQTAWALLALLAVGERGSREARRGVDYLARSQRADGDWDEQLYTGTGFPGDFYIRYHMYRSSFPLMALGRFLCAERT